MPSALHLASSRYVRLPPCTVSCCLVLCAHTAAQPIQPPHATRLVRHWCVTSPRPSPALPPQAVFSAAAKLCIRSLGSSEPVASIIFAMAGVSTIGSALFCAVLPSHFVVPRSAAAWGLLLAAGLLGCGVQLLATTALKLSKAAPTIAMSYSAGGEQRDGTRGAALNGDGDR